MLHKSKEVVQLLLQLKVNIQARDQFSQTPLHYAARSNNKEAAEFLLQHNAAIEARPEENLTRLHVAAQSNSTEVAHYSFNLMQILKEKVN